MGLPYKILGPQLKKAKISDTERTALEKSDVGIEQGFFVGRPDWDKLRALPSATLTPEEKEFLDTKGNALASRANEQEIKDHKDLPPDLYDRLKKEGWWGLIAGKEHGGLGFSAVANSEAIIKFSSVSPELAVTYMVPNSLGPMEVLEHFGTEEQKNEWLPRLTSGEVAPCFALTSLNGGSDAFDGMENIATVFEEDGELKINVDKISNRYITLAPLKGVAVLSFKLRDPNNLLGKGPRPGVTLALVDLNNPNIQVGSRHNPMGIYFQNGPVEGKNVVLSVDKDVIGGRDGIGQGVAWLMQLLGAGRGISLPALSAAAGKLATAAVGRYSRIRKQFGTSIGDFPGIQQKLAVIAGNTYTMDAARRTTLRMIVDGQKPTIASAIVKVHMTEMMRDVCAAGMGIMAGAAVMNGPRNVLAELYKAFPISETVEGANIMTENLIIFGQGLMVDHPYLYKMIQTAQSGDKKGFEENFKAHVASTTRSFLTSTTGLANAKVPDDVHPDLKNYYKQINRYSAGFALAAATIAGVYQQKLKFAEDVTRRMGQVLSHMYLAMSVLEDHYDRGAPEDELPLVHWAVQNQFNRLENSFEQLFDNLPGKGLQKIMWSGLRHATLASTNGAKPPSDKLNHQLARILTTPNPVRERMTEGIYVPSIREKFNELAADGQIVETKYTKPLAALIEAEAAVIAAEPVEAKLRAEVRKEQKLYDSGSEQIVHPEIRKMFEEVAENDRDRLLSAAFADAIIDKDEYELMVQADALRTAALSVDVYTQDMRPL